MEYVMLKLITGEEIVGKCDYPGSDGEHYHIYDPHTISWAYDSEGNYGMNIFPFLWAGEDRLFTFRKKDVIVWNIPNKTLRDYYDRYTAKAAQKTEDEEVLEAVNAPTSDLIQ